MVRRYGRVDLARISLVLPVKQARHRHLLTGGNVPLASEAERNWRTNWPVHVAVFVAAGVEIALAPGGSAIVLALLWAASYGLTHWAYIVRQVRGAGECGVAMMTVLAMALLTVSDNGLHLFVTFPLIWIMLETFIRGLLATVAAATAMVLVVIWSEGGVNGDVLGSALAMGFGVAAFSIGLAAWIWRVEVRSHERRELVARLSETVSELEAARAELASKERSQGAADERARIAADIHDTLAQSFSSIAILAQAARQNDSVRPGLIEQIEVAARDGLAEARGLLARSRPPMDLALAVKRLARDLSERTGIRASVDSARWQPAATRLEVVLLRVAQEALRNVERHSHAGEVRVILKVDDVDDVAVLEVHDDGEGFDADLPSPGYGLHGMRSRLEIEGGSLGVASSRGHGTTLTARLPFQAAEGTGA